MAIRRMVASQPNLPIMPTQHAPEAATQTFKGGAPVTNSTGKLAEPANNAGISAGTIEGFTLHDASGVTSRDVLYAPAIPGIVLEACIDGALVATNAPGTGAVALADLMAEYGLERDAATGFWYVDQSNTTTKHVKVVELVDAVGTVQGRVRCRLLHSAMALVA